MHSNLNTSDTLRFVNIRYRDVSLFSKCMREIVKVYNNCKLQLQITMDNIIQYNTHDCRAGLPYLINPYVIIL